MKKRQVLPMRFRSRIEAQADPLHDDWASGELAKLWATPTLFPISMRPADNKVVLVPLSEALYRRASFLDDREIPTSRSLTVPLDQLIEASRATVRAWRRPVHCIFHIAFCGSTLLARCLDRLAGALVLKEPYSFHEMAVCRRSEFPRANATELWLEAFRLLLALLARTFEPQQTAIVKPTDAATNLLTDVLVQAESSRVLLVHVSLEEFLQSVLRIPERRVFVRDRLEDMHVLLDEYPFFREEDWRGLGDAEQTACLWWLHGQLHRQLARETAGKRCRSLSFSTFLVDPVDTLVAVARLFDIPASSREIEAAVAREMSVYSKDPGKAFTVADREAALRAAGRGFRKEIRAGLKWAERHLARYPLLDDQLTSLTLG